MIKVKAKDMPVITIHIDTGNKQKLLEQAEVRGLTLAAYCRLLLLESLLKKE